MEVAASDRVWDLSPVIGLLHTLSPILDGHIESSTTYEVAVPAPVDSSESCGPTDLGNFKKVFEYLHNVNPKQYSTTTTDDEDATEELSSSLEREKAVKWRDEVDNADLEDNVDLEPSAASLRTKNRAARRAKAKLRKKAAELTPKEEPGVERPPVETDTASSSDSDAQPPVSPLERSANRKAVIQGLLSTPGRKFVTPLPLPPPKTPNSTFIKKELPPADPFTYTPNSIRFYKQDIKPFDDLPANKRRWVLVQKLSKAFLHEAKYLKDQRILKPSFLAQNIAPEGIHIFVDISNILIGFHDRLKMNRHIGLDQKIHRVPMDFHNFSLLLERGRPTAKRVLVGSDQFPHIDQARSLGYETNILERVHKAKVLKKDGRASDRTPAKNGFTTSGGGSSGSETNTMGPAKWVEQAVDEILHLKILESVIDADKPGTIVLATGDAAIAEYSGGFLRMVERALGKGWMVELVSFKAGLSNLYKTHAFRNRWGPMFHIIELDEFTEYFLDIEVMKAASFVR